jgi:hypothetical protein
MVEKYYLITFNDSYDDGFGGNHAFQNTIALSNKSPLYPIYSHDCISREEITFDEYVKHNEGE